VKAYLEWRYSSTHSLNSEIDGGVWSASRTYCLIPRERAHVTRCMGGWVGPRDGLDAVVKKKFPAPVGTRNPDHPARSPALYR
jgi:hypothetical protein